MNGTRSPSTIRLPDRRHVVSLGGLLLAAALLSGCASPPKPLRDRPGYVAWSPAFSPDGRTLAIVWQEAGRLEGFELEIIDLATGRTIASPAQSWSPYPPGFPIRDNAFSPDGSRMLVQRRLDWTADLEGKVAHRVMAYDLAADTWRVVAEGDINTIDTPWSPDGDRLLVSCWVPGTPRWELTILGLDDGTRTPLLSRHVDRSYPPGWAARWAPDGRSVYALDEEAQIVTLSPGRDPRRSRHRLDAPFFARFSPDCRRIAWTRATDELWVLDLSTGEDRRLLAITTLPESLRIGTDLAWSPQGDRIAATAGGARGSKLLLVDVATGDVRHRRWPQDIFLGDVAWSPDGRQLAVAGGSGLRARDAKAFVWLIDANP